MNAGYSKPDGCRRNYRYRAYGDCLDLNATAISSTRTAVTPLVTAVISVKTAIVMEIGSTAVNYVSASLRDTPREGCFSASFFTAE